MRARVFSVLVILALFALAVLLRSERPRLPGGGAYDASVAKISAAGPTLT